MPNDTNLNLVVDGKLNLESLAKALASQPKDAVRAALAKHGISLTDDGVAVASQSGTGDMPTFVDVPGSPDGKVQPMKVSTTSVTNRMWAKYMKDDPTAKKPAYWDNPEYNHPDQPVVGVSWLDCKKYADFYGYRLPTSLERKHFMMAGAKTRFWSGDSDEDLKRVGWCYENSGGKLQKVALKPANPWGLFDVHGNVWEWCADSPPSN